MEAVEERGHTGGLEFVAPGPGTWTVDGAHCPSPQTAHSGEVFPEALFAGFSEGFRRYGVLLDGPRLVRIHGFSYSQMEPAPLDELRERIEAAARAFETRLWRDDLRRWDEEVKPDTLRRHAAVRAVDLASLDDAALAAEVLRCRDHHVAMIRQHHRFNAAALLPVGDFLAHAAEWTGLAPARLSELFAGASPVSSGDSDEIRALLAAIAGDAPASQALDGEEPAELVERLARCTDAVAAALAQWLALVGDRIVDGFDVCFPRALERPAFLAAALRSAADRGTRGGRTASAEAVAAVRDLVPDAHRAQFDDLYAEARLVYRLRDERGVYSDITGAGLMRRAMLAAGARLHARGVLPDADLAVDATASELAALLSGAGGPTFDELAERAAHRRRWTVADVPAWLGDPPKPPPPFAGVPEPAARMMRAIATVGSNMGQPPDDAAATGAQLAGIAVGGGTVTGPARLVRAVEDLAALEPGDVLVAMATSEAFNMAITLAAAVVTDHGGALSHAAILARELGIPAVVGTTHGTSRIPKGATVTVDGDAGTVRWTT